MLRDNIKPQSMNKTLILLFTLLSFSSGMSQITGETVVAGALVHNFKGLEAGAQSDLKTAEDNFRRALHYMPYFARSLVNLQICKDTDAGVITKRQAFLLFKSKNNLASESPQKILGLTNIVLKKSPNYIPAYLTRAQINRKLNLLEKAEADYGKAVELSPGYALASYFRGNFFSGLGKYKKAISDFTKTIEIDPSYAPAFLERGIALTSINEHDKAIRDFEVALAAWPKWAATFKIFGAYLNRGMENIKKKAYNTALSDLSRAIELNPKFAESYLNRGIVFENLKEFDKAILDFNYAIVLQPGYAEAYYNRGHVFKTRRKFDLAIADYLKTVEFEPEHKQAHYTLGELYIKQKKFDKCIPHFARVSEIDSRNYWAIYWKALALEKIENYPEAINSYTAFLQKAPADHKNHKKFARQRVKQLTEFSAK